MWDSARGRSITFGQYLHDYSVRALTSQSPTRVCSPESRGVCWRSRMGRGHIATSLALNRFIVVVVSASGLIAVAPLSRSQAPTSTRRPRISQLGEGACSCLASICRSTCLRRNIGLAAAAAAAAALAPLCTCTTRATVAAGHYESIQAPRLWWGARISLCRNWRLLIAVCSAQRRR